MDILTAVQAKGIQLKRVSTTNGGEWAGPCPGCGDGGKGSDSDRFHVWPEKKGATGGGWWCRRCGKSGDLIEFYRWSDGLSYGEACRAAGLDPKKYDYSKPNLSASAPTRSFEPKTYSDPSDAWREKATAFVESCHAALISSPAALKKLFDDRGINTETAVRFKLGLNTADFYRPRAAWGLPTEIRKETGKPKKLWIPRGLVIPYIAGDVVQRIRVRRPKADLRTDKDPRYYFVPGSSPAIMRIGDHCRAYAVIESELDAILTSQEAGDLAGTIGMGTSSSKPDQPTMAHLEKSEVILVSLDFDLAGEDGSDWWLENFKQAERWPVPSGKDPGDMFKHIDMRTWVLAGLPPAWRVSAPTGPSALPCVLEGGGGEVEDALPASVVELGGLLRELPV